MGNENASDFYHLSSAHVGKLASRTNVKSGQWLPYRIGSLGTLTAAVSNRSIVVVSLCYCSLSEYACLHRWCTEAEPYNAPSQIGRVDQQSAHFWVHATMTHDVSHTHSTHTQTHTHRKHTADKYRERAMQCMYVARINSKPTNIVRRQQAGCRSINAFATPPPTSACPSTISDRLWCCHRISGLLCGATKCKRERNTLLHEKLDTHSLVQHCYVETESWPQKWRGNLHCHAQMYIHIQAHV